MEKVGLNQHGFIRDGKRPVRGRDSRPQAGTLQSTEHEQGRDGARDKDPEPQPPVSIGNRHLRHSKHTRIRKDRSLREKGHRKTAGSGGQVPQRRGRPPTHVPPESK